MSEKQRAGQRRRGKRFDEAHGKPCVECGKMVGPRSTRCGSCCKRGVRNAGWRGGVIKNSHGYAYILCLNHPYAGKDGRVCEHRLVMEGHLGRTLLPTEVVHHINNIKDDNRIENLMLFSDAKSHVKYHRKKGKNK